MGKVMFLKKGEVHTAPVGVPPVEVGTIWLFTENGTFTVPANGKYRVEMHGGGGGGASSQLYTVTTDGYYHIYIHGPGGGGSGEIYEVTYTKNTEIPITIGAGGSGGPKLAGSSGNGSDGGSGGTTSCGNLSIAGGRGGSFNNSLTGGAASGSLATAGANGISNVSQNDNPGVGGQGNKNNTAQTYGDGGNAGGFRYGESQTGSAGQPGAVIITYLGKE